MCGALGLAGKGKKIMPMSRDPTRTKRVEKISALQMHTDRASRN